MTVLFLTLGTRILIIAPMKNILTTLFVFSCIILLGQKLDKIDSFKEPVITQQFQLKPGNSVPFRTYGSTWFNIHNDLINLFVLDNDASKLVLFPIFPDSTIYLGFNSSNEPVSANLHGAADIINPSMTPGNWIDAWGEVIIDSVDIFKGYTRNTDSSVVDTLFVDFIKSGNASTYIDIIANGEYDPGEFSMQPIQYDYANNKLVGSQVIRTDTILLTEADSSTYITSTIIDVNDTVKGEDRYGVFARFQPGFTWTANNDTLTKYNTFFMVSREQETGKYPTQYWADNAGFASYILPTIVRYNQAVDFNGALIPTVAYTDVWKLEHHYIWYKLTSNELGIKDVSLNVKSVGTYPNPAISNTTVSFTLNQRDDVVMRITDLSGRVIETFMFGDLASGEHLEEINLSKYKNGNYILSVNGSSKIITVVH